MLVSIVIPVYNSLVVGELAERILAVFDARSEDSCEIIFVDDSSPNPGVWPILEELAGKHKEVIAIQLTRNFGQQPATLCGFSESKGDVVITMDDDLQHLPEDIPKLLEESDYDIVVGQFAQKKHSLFKRSTSYIKGIFDQIILGKPKSIQLTAFRLLNRYVVDGVLRFRTPNPFIPALMFHVSKRVAGVQVTHAPRTDGESGYSTIKLIRLFTNLIFNNSSLVLRFVGIIGISFATVSIFMAGMVVYRKLVYGIALQGWASLFSATLLIGGLLLFSIGIIGEYLLRIIETGECRPTYLVRKRATYGPSGGVFCGSSLQQKPDPTNDG